MSLGRERIYAALFNELQTQIASTNPDAALQIQAVNLTPLPKVQSPAFNFGSRRPIPIGTLELPQYPALMMLEKGEIYDRETDMFGPARLTLIAHVIVQTASGQDPNDIPATEMNNLCDVVEDLVETGAGQFPPGSNRLALPPPEDDPAGLVFVCRITGREVAYFAVRNQVFSQADFEVEIIGNH